MENRKLLTEQILAKKNFDLLYESFDGTEFHLFEMYDAINEQANLLADRGVRQEVIEENIFAVLARLLPAVVRGVKLASRIRMGKKLGNKGWDKLKKTTINWVVKKVGIKGKLLSTFKSKLKLMKRRDIPKVLGVSKNTRYLSDKFAEAYEEAMEGMIEDGPFKDDLVKQARKSMSTALKKNFKSLPAEMVGQLKKAIGL